MSDPAYYRRKSVAPRRSPVRTFKLYRILRAFAGPALAHRLSFGGRAQA